MTWRRIVLGIMGTMLLGVNSAKAVSLADLLAGGSITVQDKVFSNWQLATNGNTISGDDSLGRTSFDLNNIIVTGIEANVGPDECPDPILSFTTLNNELRITQAGINAVVGALSFSFDIDVLPFFCPDGSLCEWYANSLTAEFAHDPMALMVNDHLAEIQEIVYTQQPGSTFIGEKDRHLIWDDTDTINEDESGVPVRIDFARKTSGTIVKNLDLKTTFNTEWVEIVSFDQQFYQTCVPEPSSLGLAGLGLIGVVIGGLRGRRNRKSNVA